MNIKRLAHAVRAESTKLRLRDLEQMEKSGYSDQLLCDSYELIAVLARILEGRPVYKAFGAPGDWGHSTGIGQALSAPASPSSSAPSASPR